MKNSEKGKQNNEATFAHSSKYSLPLSIALSARRSESRPSNLLGTPPQMKIHPQDKGKPEINSTTKKGC